MKKLSMFFVMTVFVFTAGQAQNLAAYGGKKHPDSFESVGLILQGGASFIGRPGLNSITDGEFEAGLFFGKSSVNFLMTAGVFTQSEVVRYDMGGGMCNTCPNGHVLDWQRFLTASRFQIGFGGQSSSTTWMLSGGIATVQRNFGQWILDEEGGEIYNITPLARQTLPTGDLRFRHRTSSGLLSLRFSYLGTYDLVGSSAHVSYLLDLKAPGQFFGIGPHVGVRQHVLSGTEYQAGAEMLLSGSEDFRVFALKIQGGISYNPIPTEGVGWFVSFAFEVNRQNKRIFY